MSLNKKRGGDGGWKLLDNARVRGDHRAYIEAIYRVGWDLDREHMFPQASPDGGGKRS